MIISDVSDSDQHVFTSGSHSSRSSQSCPQSQVIREHLASESESRTRVWGAERQFLGQDGDAGQEEEDGGGAAGGGGG